MSHNKFLTNDELYKLSSQIIDIIVLLHEKCIIHGDLKLHNFVYDIDGKIKVIDLNSASDTDDKTFIFTCGSPGFASRSRLLGEKPDFSDDVYSFGAMLYYLATNANPVSNPLRIDRAFVMPNKINCQLDKTIEECIVNCLEMRFSSILEAKKNLLLYEQSKVRDGLMLLDEQMVFITHSFVQKIASSGPNNQTHYVTKDNNHIYDLRGTAGCILALSYYSYTRSERSILDVLINNVDFLFQEKTTYNFIPGLYVGEAGKALSALYCGIFLRNKETIEKARQKLIRDNNQPFLATDLFHGIAGRLRVNCIFWEIFKDDIFKKYAESMFEYLCKTSCCSQEEVYWCNPSKNSTEKDYTLNNNEVFLGYAHGVAGVADAILDYYIISNDNRALPYLDTSIKFLMMQSQKILNNAGLAWPDKKNGRLTLPFWCHGSIGIAKFLSRAFKYGLLRNGEEILESIVRPSIEVNFGALPIKCHGFIGILECLLDLYQATGNNKYLKETERFGGLLTYWTKEIVDNNFDLANPDFQFKDYMTGAPGLISSLVRLNNVNHPDLISLEFSQMITNEEKFMGLV